MFPVAVAFYLQKLYNNAVTEMFITAIAIY